MTLPTQKFDQNKPAENGMRRGFTTGSCASAAVKAAIQLLQFDQVVTDVHVTLPGGEHYLVIPIASVRLDSSSCATAEVIKDAGDDPDNTNNATIFATVSKNGTDVHKFIAGGGVGTVTQPGIRVAVGEPAINPGPRQMMLQTISELYGDETPPGFDIKIGCINGVEIAKRTFNPRLGIINGISILGTTGIVEPFSLAAYMASIEVYIRVALGESPDAIAFLPGNIGIRFSRDILGLTQTQTVHISNYIGFSIAHAEKILLEQNRRLSKLWLLGHPGKLGKLLNDEWDTHSSKSAMAMGALARVADSFGFSNQVVQSILESNTVEAVVEMLSTHSDAKEFWKHAERLIADMVSKRISTAKTIEVRLFGMAGSPLGEALGELNLPLGAVR